MFIIVLGRSSVSDLARVIESYERKAIVWSHHDDQMPAHRPIGEAGELRTVLGLSPVSAKLRFQPKHCPESSIALIGESAQSLSHKTVVRKWSCGSTYPRLAGSDDQRPAATVAAIARSIRTRRLTAYDGGHGRRWWIGVRLEGCHFYPHVGWRALLKPWWWSRARKRSVELCARWRGFLFCCTRDCNLHSTESGGLGGRSSVFLVDLDAGHLLQQAD